MDVPESAPDTPNADEAAAWTGAAQASGPLPGVSVVICTKGRPRELKTAVASVLRQDVAPVEIIIVDASDDDETERVVDAGFTCGIPAAGLRVPIKYIRDRSWLTRQRNVGARAATGDIVQFLDDDIVLRPGYLRELAGAYAERPEVGGAMGVIEENARRKPGGTFLERLFMLNRVLDGNMQRSGLPTWLADAEDVTVVDHLNGCMSFRREVFDEFASDETLGGYGVMEDIDLSYRVGRKWVLVVVPRARMSHRVAPGGRISTGGLIATKVYNHYYLFRKNLAGRGGSWPAFLWSQFGFLLTTLKFYRSAEAARGLLMGYGMIWKSLSGRGRNGMESHDDSQAG